MTLRGSWAIGVLVALALSLAVNFTLGGFVSARLLGPHPPHRGGGGFSALLGSDRAYPPEMQDELRQAVFDDPAMKERIRALIDSRRKMFEIMRADPYDPAALQAVLAEIETNTTALQEAGHRILEKVVAETPPDVRAEIGWRRHHGDRDHRGPPHD